MPKHTNQIYDKIIKKILTLSGTAVINLINGLFDTNYPLDSTITYNWTEFENDNLKRILADTIITINDVQSYHIEAQMTNDTTIVFRIFEYGYCHADRNRSKEDDTYWLQFPEPKIIYLYAEGEVPDKYTLRLDFGSQGSFDYQVSTFKYWDTSIEELNKKKMIILIPFQLLKLRKLIKKERSLENLNALKNLIQHDIINSINENLRVENITLEDALKLKHYTQKLYEHLYSHYDEMQDFEDMSDESFMTEIDIICKERDEALAAKNSEIAKLVSEIAKKINEIAKKDSQIAEKNSQIAEKDSQIAEKNSQIAEKDKEHEKALDEIASLKKQLADLQSQCENSI